VRLSVGAARPSAAYNSALTAPRARRSTTLPEATIFTTQSAQLSSSRGERWASPGLAAGLPIRPHRERAHGERREDEEQQLAFVTGMRRSGGGIKDGVSGMRHGEAGRD